MERNEKIRTILGVSLLYAIITSIFSLLSRLGGLIDSQSNLKTKIDFFLQRNTLWIIVVAGVIITLIIYVKKSNHEKCFNIVKNPFVLLTTGALVTIEGLISLSSQLPLRIISIKSAFQVSELMAESSEKIISKSIISNTILILSILCQLFLGIYLVYVFNKKIK